MEERDHVAVGAAPRYSVDQANTGCLHARKFHFNIRHAVGDVMQFRRCITAEARDGRVAVEGTQ